MKFYGFLCAGSVFKAGKRGSPAYLELKWQRVSHQSIELCCRAVDYCSCLCFLGWLKHPPEVLCQNLATKHHQCRSRQGLWHTGEQVWVIPSPGDPVRRRAWSWITSRNLCWGCVVLQEDFQGCQLVFPQSSRPRWDGFVIPAQFLVSTVSEQGKSCICYPVEHDSSHVLLKLFR